MEKSDREKRFKGFWGPKMLELVCSHIQLEAKIQLFLTKSLRTLRRMFAMCKRKKKEEKNVLRNCHIKIKSEVCCFPPRERNLVFIMCTLWHANKQKAREESD